MRALRHAMLLFAFAAGFVFALFDVDVTFYTEPEGPELQVNVALPFTSGVRRCR